MSKSLATALAAAALLVPALVMARTAVEAPYLTCATAHPVVSLGNAGRFIVASNVEGPFMWVAGDSGFYDAGPTFVTPMTELGEQEVVVVWGSRRASCYVNVVPQGGYGEPYTYLPYGSYNPGFGPGPNVTLTSVKLSAIPYTGIDIPLTTLGYMAALLSIYGVLVYPYARKAFATAVR